MLRGLSLALAVIVVSSVFITPVFAQEPASLEVTLVTDKQTYAPGEPVNFTLTVTNTGAEETTLVFNTGQEVDYIVSQDGANVWKWSTGRFFTQAVQMIPIAAGETRTYREQWNQVGDNGQQAPNGQYTAIGVITAGTGIESSPVTFTIGEEQPGEPTPTATQEPGEATPTPTSEPDGEVLPETGDPTSTILLLVAGAAAVLTVLTSIVVRRRA